MCRVHAVLIGPSLKLSLKAVPRLASIRIIKQRKQFGLLGGIAEVVDLVINGCGIYSASVESEVAATSGHPEVSSPLDI